MSYRAVVFDAYDTLLYTGGTEAWGRAMEVLAEAGVSEEAWLRGWDATYAPMVKGRYSILGRTKLALELARRPCGGMAGKREFDAALADEVAGLLHVRAYPRLFAEVRPALAEVRARGYRMGLLSNIPYDEVGMIEALDLPEAFDAVVLSSLVGTMKPEAPIYLLMAERLGVAAEECVMVDDVPAYVAGAQEVGMVGVRIRRPERPPQPEVETRPDLEVANLQELLDLLPARAGE